MSSRAVRTLLALTAGVISTLAVSQPAHADFGVVPGSLAADAFQADRTTPETQAGAHPFLANFKFELNKRDDGLGNEIPDGNVRDTIVDLPPGLVGNPLAAQTCEPVDLQSNGPGILVSNCPIGSQVGTVRLEFFNGGLRYRYQVPVHNMVAHRGEVAALAFKALTVIVRVSASLRADGTYAVRASTTNINETLVVTSVDMDLWGVPGDPAHDPERTYFNAEVYFGGTWFPASPPGSGDQPFPGTPRPFMTNPVDCSHGPFTTTLEIRSWQDPGYLRYSADTQSGVTGCETVPFAPSMTTSVDGSIGDSPTALTVALAFPQDGLESPGGLATAHLRRAKVTLPEGMTINPSSAGGLAACTDAQLGLGSNEPIGCPVAAKIGTVEAVSPLLAETVDGGVYVRSQASDDPASGKMFRIAIVLQNRERGILVKLPGAVSANPRTGRLETTFDDNPQLPISSIRLTLKGGERAPLAMPLDCGSKSVDAELTSWAGQTVALSSSFVVDCPSGTTFSPSFAAGATNPVAGAFAPFVVGLDRPQGAQYLDGITLELPKGLLAKLKGVPLCGNAEANAGTCDAGSQIGSASVAAGSGTPFWLTAQPVYLAGPYKGARYSLSVVTRAVAGPFDLGTVVVRQAIHVDPVDASLTVISDPLPTIVKGVPLRLRDVDVVVDRPGFALNPTSCEVKAVAATLHSQQGATTTKESRFQVGECATLGFKPKLAMRLVGRGRTRTGAHPALRAVLTQASGQSNVGRAEVTLPKSVVLDARNSYDPKLVCGYDEALKADCPKSSVIGKATARTPVLNKPLNGNVHLVQGIKFGKSGNRIRTTPSLLVKLRGEVAIDLRAKTTVKHDRLVTTFPEVPDAPVSKFSLQINGGKKGILVVTRTRKAKINVCDSKQIADVETDGHNGKRHDFAARVKTPCKARKTKVGR